MSNKKNGNDFEQEFCMMLAEQGFWAHNMANRANGQPADIIAARNGIPFLIDCKDCKRNIFELSRIEDNQHSAMRRWELCGNNQGLFALKTSVGIYIVRYGVMQVLLLAGRKRLTLNDMKLHGIRFAEWVESEDGTWNGLI